MTELIKIENRDGKKTCNARELHTFLGSKRDFSNWVKQRIEKFGFVENEDFTRLNKKVEANNATMKEYYISLDMAKELCMVENNEKGREARRYFIACEKQLKNYSLPDFSNPAIAARAWADEFEKRQLAETEVKNKTGYIKDLTKNEMFDAEKSSKILNFEKLGRNNFLKLLRSKKILNDKNIPYQRYINSGYCSIISVVRNEKRFDVPVFSQKGIEYIRSICLKDGYNQRKNLIKELQF